MLGRFLHAKNGPAVYTCCMNKTGQSVQVTVGQPLAHLAGTTVVNHISAPIYCFDQALKPSSGTQPRPSLVNYTLSSGPQFELGRIWGHTLFTNLSVSLRGVFIFFVFLFSVSQLLLCPNASPFNSIMRELTASGLRSCARLAPICKNQKHPDHTHTLITHLWVYLERG